MYNYITAEKDIQVMFIEYLGYGKIKVGYMITIGDVVFLRIAVLEATKVLKY